MLLLSDHDATGGTRDYLDRLLAFYVALGWDVTLLSAHERGRDIAVPPGGRVTNVEVTDVLGPGGSLVASPKPTTGPV